QSPRISRTPSVVSATVAVHAIRGNHPGSSSGSKPECHQLACCELGVHVWRIGSTGSLFPVAATLRSTDSVETPGASLVGAVLAGRQPRRAKTTPKSSGKGPA